MTQVFLGEDGKARCNWPLMAGNADYLAYHDAEWGRPVHGESLLFERLSLEAFQSGLSWLTILRKRENFRQAFAGFDPEKVAIFGQDRVEELLLDAGIIRNQAKIEATIDNAQALLELRARGESLEQLLQEYQPAPRPDAAPIPAQTAESLALSKALKKRGFKFVGPTTAYAMMQAVGIVNDHHHECWVYGEL